MEQYFAGHAQASGQEDIHKDGLTERRRLTKRNTEALRETVTERYRQIDRQTDRKDNEIE